MQREPEIEFAGVLGKVTPDGRCAVVVIDDPRSEWKYAVLNLETRGKVELMNQSGGVLKTGTSVSGTAIRGAEALIAITVRPAPAPA